MSAYHREGDAFGSFMLEPMSQIGAATVVTWSAALPGFRRAAAGSGVIMGEASFQSVGGRDRSGGGVVGTAFSGATSPVSLGESRSVNR